MAKIAGRARHDSGRGNAGEPRRASVRKQPLYDLSYHQRNLQGLVGPDLTHLASRTTIAAGVLANNPQLLSEWIEHPDEMKPGARMPDFGLTGDDLNDLVAYLESLK